MFLRFCCGYSVSTHALLLGRYRFNDCFEYFVGYIRVEFFLATPPI